MAVPARVGTFVGTPPAYDGAVISIAMLRGGRDAAGYYLDRQAGCEADYYLDRSESAGRWCGRGAEALGLTGELDEAGRECFRRLLAGQTPAGDTVTKPVVRPHPGGLLPVAPLLAALADRAQSTGRDLPTMLADPVLIARHDQLRKRLEADSRTGRVVADAGVLGGLAAAAGVDPTEVYGKRFAAAARHAGEKIDARRSALDLTVSPPKSVSVLHGLADRATARQIQAAHDVAVGEAIRYLERVASHAMRGHQGHGQRTRRVETTGLVAAAFTHRTSRAEDPQLHSHVVVANLLHGNDGRWSAVDSRAIHRHARAAGCIYQPVLRGQVTERLGVAWTPVRRDVAEVAGVPRPLCRLFSQQRTKIDAELVRTGGTGRVAAQHAAYRVRPAKSHTPELSLRERWSAAARAAGHDPATLVASVIGRQRPPSLPRLDTIATQLLGPRGLTEKQTSFDRRDVIAALGDSLPPGARLDGHILETLAEQLVTNPEAIRLHAIDDQVPGPRFTASNLLQLELLALDRSRQSGGTSVDQANANAAVAAIGLNAEQRSAVRRLLTSRSALAVVIGPAGSGKTAALAVAHRTWRDSGTPVVGAALAAVTARRLEAATGIASSSVARLIEDLERLDAATGRPAGLAPGGVLVIDEASMVGTRQLAALLHHTTAAGRKLVLVGDDKQLPEVEAGGLFAALPVQQGPIVLSGNERQGESWERKALARLRDGAIGEALDAYLGHQRVHLGIDSRRLLPQSAEHYAQVRRETGAYGVVVLTSRRSDVDRLNNQIRNRLQDVGALGPDIAVGNRDGTAS